MKIFTDKSVTQKIIIALVIVILTTFSVPTSVQADVGGKLASPVINLIVALFDGVQHLLEYAMLGETSSFMKDIGSGDYDDTAGEVTITTDEFIDATFFGLNAVNVPKITYTPEAIFSNKVPALDVNFINPSIKGNDERNVAVNLQPIIASWYVAIRTMSIVGLLSVLVYLGIRMLLSSLAADRAKYKQMLFDWVVAICLVFALHYIMSFALTMAETVTAMISSDAEGMFTVNATNIDGLGFSTYSITFGSNLMSYVRFMVQAGDFSTKIAFFALYIMLVIYSIRFTWVYLKRVVNMAFLTLIAPMVALTYPIDKVSDGKAQAFNMWMKEFTYNALIQPLHLLLYIVLLGSAVQLAADNPLYAIVCLGFIIAAEKLMKSMFGFNKASGGTLGSLAGAAGVTALASKGLNTVASQAIGKGGGGSNNGKVRTKDGYQREGRDNDANKDFKSFNRADRTAMPEMEDNNTPPNNRDRETPPPDSRDRETPPPSDDMTQDEEPQHLTDDDVEVEAPDRRQMQQDYSGDMPQDEESVPHLTDDEVEEEAPDRESMQQDYSEPTDDNPVTDGSPLPGETEQTLRNLRQPQDNDEEPIEVTPRATARQQRKAERKAERREKAKRTLKGVAAGAGTFAYSAARGTVKTAARAGMGIALAGMAGIIGATTGDGEKAMSMAAAGFGLGATAGGKMFEGSAGKLIKQKSVRDSYDRAKYGSRIDARNARADKEYVKSEEFEDYYDKYFKGQYTKKEVKDTFTAYRKTGITDKDTIRKAMKLEQEYARRKRANNRRGLTEQEIAKEARGDVQNIVQNYKNVDARAFYNEEAKNKQLKSIESQLDGITDARQKQAMAREIFRGFEDWRNL